MFPVPLQRLVDHFESLSELERREGLIDLADQAQNHRPDSAGYHYEDIRRDTDCSDTVGIHLRVDARQSVTLAISMGCQVQTLTRAMATVLCKGIQGSSLPQVLALDPGFVQRIVGQHLVQLRARTIYYLLARVKEAAKALLARMTASEYPAPDWTTWQATLRATLMFVVDEAQQRVLLIRKKRGLGAGKINGPGGKRDPGESDVECAVRETVEELHVKALNPVKHGELWFHFTDGLAMVVSVYRATRWEGEPQETPEAAPLWTPLDALPFAEMWEDDRYWLHEVLVEQRHFIGKFHFHSDLMLSHQLEWISESVEM
jgi:8-oxo-dGTP diphosphatase